MPDWYPVLTQLSRAAKILNCSVFDLRSQPDAEIWANWAEAAALAEWDATHTTKVEIDW